MKQLKLIMLGLALVAVTAPALALGPLDINADLALNSKYVWRGQILAPDPVLQPALSVNFLGFGLGAWGNMDTSDYNGTKSQFNEIDYTLSYDLSLPLVSVGAGAIYYDFPNTGFDATTELYIYASAGVILSPKVIVYQDVDTYKGAYWELSIGHGFEVSPGTNLDLSGGLGLGSKSYLKGYYGWTGDVSNPNEVTNFTGASMSNFYITASLPYQAFPFFTFTPSIGYSSLMGDAKDAVNFSNEGNPASEIDPDAFVFGMKVSFSF